MEDDEIERGIWLDTLQMKLSDAQHVDIGLETDDVYDEIMDSLGYSESDKRAVYDDEEETFLVLCDVHSFPVIEIRLGDAIKKLIEKSGS